MSCKALLYAPFFLSPSTIKHLSPSTETWVFFIKCACKALHYASFFESFHSESFQKQTMQNLCFYNIHSAPTHRITTAVVSSSFKMTLKKKKKWTLSWNRHFNDNFANIPVFFHCPVCLRDLMQRVNAVDKWLETRGGSLGKIRQHVFCEGFHQPFLILKEK